jgi:tRNA (guanine-N7-)-methyltransferase
MTLDSQPKRILYGRRRGKTLRQSQQRLVDELLPNLTVPMDSEVLDPSTLFSDQQKEYWLEIGFGAGEHLAWQGEHHPEAGIIGCEPFLNGVAGLLSKIEAKSLTNIRVHNEAAEHLLSKIPPASFDKAFLLFADPWHKSSHQKRRFVSKDNVKALAHVLKDDCILRVGTDHTDYGAWILHYFLASDAFEWIADQPTEWLVRGDDWPQTRYEAKALREGRRSVYYRFKRKRRAQ